MVILAQLACPAIKNKQKNLIWHWYSFRENFLVIFQRAQISNIVPLALFSPISWISLFSTFHPHDAGVNPPDSPPQTLWCDSTLSRQRQVCSLSTFFNQPETCKYTQWQKYLDLKQVLATKKKPSMYLRPVVGNALGSTARICFSKNGLKQYEASKVFKTNMTAPRA